MECFVGLMNDLAVNYVFTSFKFALAAYEVYIELIMNHLHACMFYGTCMFSSGRTLPKIYAHFLKRYELSGARLLPLD